jgi:CTP synthase (UTP-ammonia lyase)
VEIEMNQSLKIRIVGDFDQSRPSQLKTIEAIDHVSTELPIAIDTVWLPTKSLERQTVTSKLRDFHAIWAGPGDYENPEGVIKAIRYCREKQWPFIGT